MKGFYSPISALGPFSKFSTVSIHYFHILKQLTEEKACRKLDIEVPESAAVGRTCPHFWGSGGLRRRELVCCSNSPAAGRTGWEAGRDGLAGGPQLWLPGGLHLAGGAAPPRLAPPRAQRAALAPARLPGLGNPVLQTPALRSRQPACGLASLRPPTSARAKWGKPRPGQGSVPTTGTPSLAASASSTRGSPPATPVEGALGPPS